MSSKSNISSPELRARRTAEALREVYAFIQSSADLEDFLRGYSLSAAVQERLDIIGEPLATEALQEVSAVTGTKKGKGFTARGTPTLEAELLALEVSGLAAIDAAMEIAQTAGTTGSDANKDAEAIIDGIGVLKVDG